MARHPRLPDNGRLLQLVALGHALVGSAVYREELRMIAGDRIAGAIPYRGAKATAFWFFLPSPLLWVLGGLMRGAEEAGDGQALRKAHWVSLVSAIVAVICLPVSGFWAWLAISLRGLRDARRIGS